jgi:uncharacterized cupin superfamily protein
MPRANIFTDACRLDPTDPDGYRAAQSLVGAAAGGRALTVRVYEVPADQSVCPYHYEYEEEWLAVLDGAVVLRDPEGEHLLGRGDLVCFAPGPAGAHKVTNRAGETARIMMFSSSREPSVAVYPDSDKIGVWPGNPADHVILRRADGAVDYYDGEP